MSKIYLLSIVISLLSFACASIPSNTHQESKKIKVDYGPEDMVLDTSISYDRLLVFCDARRKKELKDEGSIYEIRLSNDKPSKLIRKNEPQGFVFHPHGIDFVCQDEDCFLYVISHQDKNKKKGIKKDKHFICKYLVKEKELIFVDSFHHPLFVSPNAVAALSDGSFYVTNDAGKRNNFWELVFKKKKSKVIYCDGKKNYSIAAEKLAMANGIGLKDEYAYVATTRQNKLFRYQIDRGKLINRTEIIQLKGQDNIRFHQDKIILAIHLKDFAFMRHLKNAKKKSPTVVYLIDPKLPNSASLLYANDGKQISAGATGIIYKNQLYISQVFDPFILKVDL